MYQRIVHATDLQQDHYAMCEQAKKFADFHHAQLYLMHVIEIPSALIIAQNLGFTELLAPAKEDAQLVLQTIAESLSLPKSHLYTEIGTVKHHILARAEELKADLIILGRHSSHGLPTLLGSTAYHVMQHAHCDVLTLSPKANG